MPDYSGYMQMRKRTCLAIDLRNEAEAIVHYEACIDGGRLSGVIADWSARGYAEMTIWRVGNRLFMIAETDAVPSLRPMPRRNPFSNAGRH